MQFLCKICNWDACCYCYYYFCCFFLLDVIDKVPHELWMEFTDIVQETGSKTIPKKREMQKSKMAV